MQGIQGSTESKERRFILGHTPPEPCQADTLAEWDVYKEAGPSSARTQDTNSAEFVSYVLVEPLCQEQLDTECGEQPGQDLQGRGAQVFGGALGF